MPEKFKFEALLDDVHDMPMFIATFLSILDLARMHTLVFTIDDNDVIWFSRGEHFL
jgi:segregation and condensation protein A